jgi:hypothetical protein
MKPTAHNQIHRAISSNEFRKAVEADPAWASKLTEPVEVTDFCDMTGSSITHLSPLLHFTGRDENGICARFWDCNSLKVAEGTFHGMVYFCDSGVQRIGDLKITDTSADGGAASFYQCAHLKVAEGTFPGFVEFGGSGVEKIGNLVIARWNGSGYAASFTCCFALKVAEGTFPGKVDFRYAGLEKIGDFHIVLAGGGEIMQDFSGCEKIEGLTYW